MKSLREKILDYQQPVIFYELLPPQQDVEQTSLDAYIECAIDLLSDSPVRIDAVNIPDIRVEEKDDHQAPDADFKPKLQNGYFAHMLENASRDQLEVVLNHCTVYEAWPEQQQWLKVAYEHYRIHTIVLVGGSSSNIHYPGPSVVEMSDYVGQQYRGKVLCGGISIQSRRHADKGSDEPQRMLNKIQHGVEFFTSQIVYDSASVKELLRDYASWCFENNTTPRRILLSFAPISTKKDFEFMRWLGVIIPPSVEKELFKTDIGIGWRSAKISANILQDILQYMAAEKIHVPLGLNIEHITRHNFELSLKFIERLGGLYYRYMGY